MFGIKIYRQHNSPQGDLIFVTRNVVTEREESGFWVLDNLIRSWWTGESV